jgi:isopenicillin N synthase-like dioxygenase
MTFSAPTTSVPTIDIGGLPDDDRAVEQIADAAENWGFFQVVNHGISQDQRESFINTTRDFFRLTADEKQKVLRTESNPMGFYDSELTKNTPDWKEVFDYGMDRKDRSSDCVSRWPDCLPGFEDTMNGWFDACEAVSFNLLAAFAMAMDVESSLLARCFDPVHTSFVRLNYYPLCNDPDSNLGINRHTDAGALTVLVQDDVPSLQVNRDGTWYTIDPEPEGLIINIGDMLQVWSNDRFQAAEHRVLANAARERFSAPFFFNPSYTTDCVPLNVPEADAIYGPVNWGHFRTQRHYGDYADYGEEIQISQFRRSSKA